MGNAPIQIGLKTDKTTYYQGETVTGTVYLKVTPSSDSSSLGQYRGIRLSFAGHEQVEVLIREETGHAERRETHHRTERESSMLLHLEVPMTEFASRLRVGEFEYPFVWQIPFHPPVPSSFRVRKPDRSGHCQVQYTLTAFLFPPQPAAQGMLFAPGNGAGSTSASQPIHVIGLPTRNVPEPLYLPCEATPMRGLCCCWRQGHIKLGWKADNIHLTPLAQCQVILTGKNCSTIAVSSLRVQLVQTVHWYTHGDDGSTPTRRSHVTTLVDYRVHVSHLSQWQAITSKPPSNSDYESANADDDNNNINDDDNNDGIPTSFQVPADTLDSYQGHHCHIQHTLTIQAVTRFLATSPSISYVVHIQRSGDTSGAGGVAQQPMAAAWLEDADYHDVVLPPKDWNPDETVPVIHVAAVTPVMEEDNSSLPTAQAVVVENDDGNPTMVDHSDPLAFARPASMTAEESPMIEEVLHLYGPDLEEIFGYLQQPRNLNEIGQWPICQRVFPTLTQEEYAYLCQAATSPQRLYDISWWLANEINRWQPQGFLGDHVTALLDLPLAMDDPCSVVGRLTGKVRDLETSVEIIAGTMSYNNPNDAQWFRDHAYAELERRQQQQQPPIFL